MSVLFRLLKNTLAVILNEVKDLKYPEKQYSKRTRKGAATWKKSMRYDLAAAGFSLSE